jgi:hypothetical protein
MELIMQQSRRGTGDMPHGWAAADYVILHRNSLVYENDDTLELCWGVQPSWLANGAAISAVNAPTKFGKLTFEMRRNQGRMRATYQLAGSNFPKPGRVSLHLPSLDDVNEITVNEKRFALERGQNVLTID